MPNDRALWKRICDKHLMKLKSQRRKEWNKKFLIDKFSVTLSMIIRC